MNFGKEISNILKLCGVKKLDEKLEQEIEHSYQLYKEIYFNNGGNQKYFVETPSSHLMGMKQYIRELKEEFPNSLNIPHYLKEERITYWERIAGFYNPLTNELDDDIKHQKVHQDADEMLENGLVRFFICDIKSYRCCFISAVNENDAKQGYKYLKNHYKTLGIKYFQLDWDGGFVTLDDKGKKAEYDNLYEFYQKFIKPTLLNEIA